MHSRSTIVLPAVLLAGLLGTGCRSGESTVAPSPPTPSTAVPTPTPVPKTPPELVGEWKLTLRLTEVKGAPDGGGCVGQAMQSQVGDPESFQLSVSAYGQVTIGTASGDYACTFFSPSMDSGGFTTYGIPGYYSCRGEPRALRCGNGQAYSLITFGQDIAARLSGNELSGTWDVHWYERDDIFGVETKTQFTGTR